MNWFFYLWEIFLFIVLVKWFVLLPGFFLLSKLKANLKNDEKLILALGLGIVFLTLTLFFFGNLKIKEGTLIFLSVLNIWFIWQQKNKLLDNLKAFVYQSKKILLADKFSFLLLILGTVITGSLIFNSGWDTDGVLLFTEYRDAMWHLGLIKELVRSIPPLHPGFALEPLTNYHYFTHLFGSFFLNFGLFNDLDFYFRLFPFLLTLFYGLNLYLLGKEILKKKESRWLLIILGYFASSFAYVLPLFVKYPNFSWHESSFWLSQPFSMVINPSFSLSASLVLLCIFLVKKISQEVNSRLFLPLILIAGSLIEFKVYAGLLVLGAGFLIGIWELIKKKNITLLLTFLGAFFISFIIFYPTSGRGAGNFLVFLPGWFLRSMVESPDRVQIIDWILREETYLQYGNWLGVLRLRFYELIIYLIGNFGVRVVGLAGACFLLLKIKQRGATFIFAGTITLVGIIVPLVFVQNGSIANTLQFSYYSLILSTLLLCVVVERALKNISAGSYRLILCIIILLSVPTSIKHLVDTWSVRHFKVVTREERQALSFLEKNSNINDIILLPATHKYTFDIMVSTLSNRRMYYSDRLMAENTLKNYRAREELINKFFQSKDKENNAGFLKNNQIRYLYIENDQVGSFVPDFFPVNKVYSNSQVNIYKVL